MRYDYQTMLSGRMLKYFALQGQWSWPRYSRAYANSVLWVRHSVARWRELPEHNHKRWIASSGSNSDACERVFAFLNCGVDIRYPMLGILPIRTYERPATGNDRAPGCVLQTSQIRQ